MDILFYDRDKELELVCPNCSATLLQMGEDGEMDVEEEYRGEMRCLVERRNEAWQDPLLIDTAVFDNEPGKLNSSSR
jgi:hypothetical protein